MKSRWFHLKERARKMRKNGSSIRDVEATLKINRSTLSGWFRDIKLTKKQKDTIHKRWLKSIAMARLKAVLWHNEQKNIRISAAKNEAKKTLNKLPFNNDIMDLALALLYFGEGMKKNSVTGMGNSDPLIL